MTVPRAIIVATVILALALVAAAALFVLASGGDTSVTVRQEKCNPYLPARLCD